MNKPKWCPYCGAGVEAENFKFVGEWTAEQKPDPEPPTTLDEWVCEACGASFWT